MTNPTPTNEADSCDQFITPAIREAGADRMTKVRRDYAFTAGRVIARGKIAAQGVTHAAAYPLFYQANLLLAVPEAKDMTYSTGQGCIRRSSTPRRSTCRSCSRLPTRAACTSGPR